MGKFERRLWSRKWKMWLVIKLVLKWWFDLLQLIFLECKPGVTGSRCTDCPADKELTPNGCVSGRIEKFTFLSLSLLLSCFFKS